MIYSVLDRMCPPKPSEKFSFEAPVLSVLMDDARAGEYYSFGIVLNSETGGRVTVDFSELTSENGTIPADAYFCINREGTDDSGRYFTKDIFADPGKDCFLWSSLRIPETAQGRYSGTVTLRCGAEKAVLAVTAEINGSVADHGFDEPEKLTRLSWLDSTAGLGGKLPSPYTAPELSGRTVSILGRSVTVGDDGLPSRFTSYFDKNIQIDGTPRTVSDGATLSFRLKDGQTLCSTPVKTGEGEVYDEGVRFTSESVYGDCLRSEITTSVEFDGYVTCRITVTALKDCDLDDAEFAYDLRDGFDGLTMGLGLQGMTTPDAFDFTWTPEKHHNILWTGGINGGLRCKWMGEDFVEPIRAIYYRHRKLRMSRSFANPDENGNIRGTISLRRGNGTRIAAHSGEFSLKKGEVRIYDSDFLMSPFKPLDMHSRMTTRYYHDGTPDPKAVAETGATHINLHHATEYHPYINYPFLTMDRLKPYVDEAHSLGLGVKLYYTVREQSDKTCEMNAFLTLGTEIFPEPDGDQSSVLYNGEMLDNFRKIFGETKIPAWPTQYDYSVVTEGDGRICNYYAEGIRYLCEKLDIDGIYIDDSAFDRKTLSRVLRLFEQCNPPQSPRPPRKIDMHCGSYYGALSGFSNTLNIHMTLLPYLDSVWIGEGFRHMATDVSYWLTEIIGLPFGIPGELLCSGFSNAKYRGMLFGATLRRYMTADPHGIWSFIRGEHMEDMKMIGFWNDESPLCTGNSNVLGTVFVGEDKCILALTNWSGETATAVPTLCGRPVTDCIIPEIPDYQDETTVSDGRFTLEAEKGVLVVVPGKITY